MDKQQSFEKALAHYLQQANMYPLFEEHKLTESGEYRNLCFMKTYYKEGDKSPYRLLVPTIAWHTLLRQVHKIFDSKINGKLVSRAIDRVISDMPEFPLSDERLKTYCDEIYQILWRNYEAKAEAIVPLYNLYSQDKFEVPLARAILNSGHEQSILAKRAKHEEMRLSLAELAKNSFLTIEVSGDNESNLAQVEFEAEQALKVLRFITMWQSTTVGTARVRFNPGSYVTIRKPGMRRIIYHNPERLDLRPSSYSDVEKSMNLSNRDLENAKEYYGLDDLNYHFGNNTNPNSERVIKSLELYDSGTRALTYWQALYRYVAAINVALPASSSNGEELAKLLETLIKYGGSYVGRMATDDDNANPDVMTWEEIVQGTAEPFKYFYMLRGKILHGNPLSEDDISVLDVENARVLAHNSVRLVAKLAREFNWQTYKEAKRWFSSPSYPTSINLSE
jgi:hypothetical protein